MSKKHTIGFIRAEFEKEGYTLLTKEYINAFQKLNYICSKGHRSCIVWNSWRQGNRCAECAGLKKLTIDFIKKEFEKEGYILLTKKYINAHQKLEYICPNKHNGDILWLNWKKGKKCAKCSGNIRLTIRFIREQFEKEGYTLLTKEYVNNAQKLDYICSTGHTGNIRWDSWKAGARCRQCYLENNRGKNHPNWNPNLTNEDRIYDRHIFGYVEWKQAIKKKDNFTCQVCGDNKGGNLVSHHLEAYSNNPDLRIALGNGVCLCEKCHKDFHHQYGYGNNTKVQFEEFKAGCE